MKKRSILHTAPRLLSAAAALLLIAGVHSASAASYTWGTDGAGGAGTWNFSNTNWYDGAVNTSWADGNDAVFGGASGGAVTTGTNVSANSLTFYTPTSGNYTLSGSSITLTGSNGLTVTGGAVAISAPIVAAANQSWDIQSGASLSSSGVISGSSYSLTKTGAGTLSLTANNTFNGGLVLSSGTLRASGNAGALGAGTLTLNGGVLDFNHSAALNFARNTTIGGDVRIIAEKDTAGAGVTYTLGSLAIGANTLTLDRGNVTSGTAGLSFGATTLTGDAIFDVGSDVSLALQYISGNYNFTKNGAGRLSFSGNAAGRTGALTTLNSGTLGMSTATALGSGTLRLNGGTLVLSRNIDVAYTGLATEVTNNTKVVVDLGTIQTLVGTASIGSYTLTVEKGATAVGSPTFGFGNNSGRLELKGSPVFDVGPGTFLTVGYVNDSGTARTITKSGAGTMTLGYAAVSLGAGTVVNLQSGTLAANNATALGSLATVNMSGGSTLSLGANQTLAALNSSNSADTVAMGGAYTLTVGGADNFDSSFAGTITGSTGALTKAGTGVFTLSSANTYGGATTVSSGTLAIGGAGSLGASGTYAGAISISSAGKFVFNSSANQVLSGVVSGSGSMLMQGSGLVTLGTANTFSGGIQVNSGTLRLGNSSALGSASGSVTIASGATLDLNGKAPTQTITISGSGVGGTGAVYGSGDVRLALADNATINATGGRINLAAATVGNGKVLTKIGTSDLDVWNRFDGNNTVAAVNVKEGRLYFETANTTTTTPFNVSSGATIAIYDNRTVNAPLNLDGGASIEQIRYGFNMTFSGPITLNSGTVNLKPANATTTLSGSISGPGGFIQGTVGTTVLSGSNTFTGGLLINTGKVQLGNAGALNSQAGSENAVSFGASSTGVLALNGNSVILSNLSSAGSGTPSVQNASVTAATLTVGNSANLSGTFAGTIQDGTGGGALSLNKAGQGSLTLPGSNSYTGATSIKAGALIVSGSLSGSSAVTVGDGANLGNLAILGGRGKVGNVTVGADAENTGAKLAPHQGTASTSAGVTLTTGTLTINSGAHLSLQLGRTSAGTTGAGDVSDRVQVADLTLNNADLELSLLTTTGYSLVQSDRLFLIINNGGAVNGAFASVNGVALAGNPFSLGGIDYAISYTANYVSGDLVGGNDVALYAVPEPSTWVFLVGGFGLLIHFQRVRNQRVGTR